MAASELDLRAVEARNDAIDAYSNDVAALLAHCRALRAVLRPFVTQGAVVYIDSELPDDVVPQFCAQSVGDFRRAAVVLGAAQDGEDGSP